MFDLSLDQKSTKIFAKSVHRQPRKGVSDTTFEGKKHQPKFKGRTLVIIKAEKMEQFIVYWHHMIVNQTEYRHSSVYITSPHLKPTFGRFNGSNRIPRSRILLPLSLDLRMASFPSVFLGGPQMISWTLESPRDRCRQRRSESGGRRWNLTADWCVSKSDYVSKFYPQYFGRLKDE